MGVDLYLEKGKEEIFMGRAYHYQDTLAELEEKRAWAREEVFHNVGKDLFELRESLDYLGEIEGELAIARFIKLLEDDGWKRVEE